MKVFRRKIQTVRSLEGQIADESGIGALKNMQRNAKCYD